MNQELIVQSSGDETQIGILEEGKLVDIFLGDSMKERLSGNIYLGRVENVLPGMQAAFVDIGLSKNAFLYIEEALLGEDVKSSEKFKINDVLKRGQEILVQIIKEPLGQKGARVSRQITLAGRHIVLMPNFDHLGISKKISDETEKERLKNILEEIKPDDMGLIARTVSENISKKDIIRDMEDLKEIWRNILDEKERTTAPAMMRRDVSLTDKMLRDLLNKDVKRVIVNDEKNFYKIQEFQRKEKLYFLLEEREEKDLFGFFNITKEIKNALSRKVWLRNGSYLIFDETEALTVIDVNTGKFVGSNDFTSTILKTNIEAAKEICRQLRLRNLGGIIIIDFIDMPDKEYEDIMIDTLNEELKKDRNKTHVFGVTNLGLVEMTRKKTRNSLSFLYEKICPYCEGRGKIISERTIFLRIKEELKEFVARNDHDAVSLEVSPNIASFLINHNDRNVRNIENRLGVNISIVENKEFRDNQYRIGKDI